MVNLRRKTIRISVALGIIAVSAPAIAKKPPELAPLELQAIQSKEFETTKENLFSAVMTVVQDTGYQVQSADLQTGFITAVSAVQQKTGFIEALAGVQSQANTKMTAYIQALPNGMARVRLNFMFSKSMSSKYGQSTNEKPILDIAVYRNAWDKIDEALFVAGALEAPKKKADEPSLPEKTTP